MLEKKLLTLGCAAGILACGACFLPTPSSQPPPPLRRPLRINLDGSRRILVSVANLSETRHVDPVAVGRWIAGWINVQAQPGIPDADVGSVAIPGDAVLQVSIVKESTISETATQAQAASGGVVQVTIDATLTGPDGAVVWRETNQPYSSKGWRPFSNSADPWSSPNLGNWVHFYVCRWLVSHILYGDG